MARRRRLLAIGTTIALVGAMASAGGASAAPRGGHWGYVAIPGSSYVLQPGDVDLGVFPNDHEHYEAALKVRNSAQAEALAYAVSDPSSPSYGHFLTPAQYRQRFAPTDLAARLITRWQTSAGMQITYDPANHLLITSDGTVAAADKAFQTDIHRVQDAEGNWFVVPLTPLYVPLAIVPFVDGLLEGTGSPTKRSEPQHIIDGAGTTNASRIDHSASRSAAPTVASESPTAVSAAPPSDGFRNARPCAAYAGETFDPSIPGLTSDFVTPVAYAPCGYKPAQLQGAYGVSSLLQQGIDGSGVTVAIVDAYASPTVEADAVEYAARNGGAAWAPGQLTQSIPSKLRFGYDDTTFGNQCDEQGWYGEETLDVEAVHTTAPGANVRYVGAASCQDDDILNAVNDIVDGHQADIITNSYGDAGEMGLDPVEVRAETAVYVQAAIEGIGVFFSSGDSGDEADNTGTRQTDFPASSPWVTAVGGTSLGVGAQDNYLTETGWGTSKYTINGDGTFTPSLDTPSHQYGGGGGTSQLFPEPKYQRGVVPSSIANYFSARTPGRAVPDIAALGDPSTGMLVGQTQTFPDGVSYDEFRIGGTSLASPLMAGMEALADQVAGHPHGFANPAIYRLKPNALHDVVKLPFDQRAAVERVDFANGVDASDGLLRSLRTIDETQSIFTRPGYDDVTGVGTPIAPVYVTTLGKKH